MFICGNCERALVVGKDHRCRLCNGKCAGDVGEEAYTRTAAKAAVRYNAADSGLGDWHLSTRAELKAEFAKMSQVILDREYEAQWQPVGDDSADEGAEDDPKTRRKLMGEMISTLGDKANGALTDVVQGAHVRITHTKYDLFSGDGEAAFSWHEGEVLAKAHMVAHGYPGARLTASGQDGGVDIRSSTGVAQVKWWAKPVGRPEIQKLYGVAQAMGTDALFYSQSGYTEQATSWARRHGVALYTFHRWSAAFR